MDKQKFNAAWDKVKQFLHAHENVFQVIKFTLLSCIAAIVEVASLNIMLAALKGYAATEVHWFIFNYAASDGGLSAFVAFIVSTILAQIVSYVVNRKKTFNANNNLLFSIIGYVIMEVVIISLQIWSGPLLAGEIARSMAGGGVITQSMNNWSQNISKFLWMFIAFVVVFLMDKFVLMRRTDDKDGEKAENGEDTENAAAEDDAVENEVEVEDSADDAVTEVETAENATDEAPPSSDEGDEEKLA